MVEQKKSDEKDQGNYTHYMHWWMYRRCNFDCEYCFRRREDSDESTDEVIYKKYSPEHIAEQFDETGKVWNVFMTGGEPFLYPRFVKLAKTLTRRHYISLSTNLSTPNLYEFAETIGSGRVLSINASLHILEREKIKDGLNGFLRNFHYYLERGFNIRLTYVTYPPLIGRIKEDIEQMKDNGIDQIDVKVFQGRYQGQKYPREYTNTERAFLRELGLDKDEEAILARRISFLGKKCQAGRKAFSMDICGNVTRCNTLTDEYGNLFDGTFVPAELSLRCTAKRCACIYQGTKFASAEPFTVPSGIVAKPVRFFAAVCNYSGSL